MKITLLNTKNLALAKAAAVCGAILGLPLNGKADSSFLIDNTTADAFLASGSAGNPLGSDLTSLNFGGVGTLAIAPASSVKGEFDSVIKFNTASAVSQFNSLYGAGNWMITGLTLSLASNFGVQGAQPNSAVFNQISGGRFGVDWLANDSWVEGNGSANGASGYPANNYVSFNSISTLFSAGSDSLGAYLYTPPGNNVYVSYLLPLEANLLADAKGGGDVSLYFYAADSQVGYLFNARSYAGNHPQLTITAAPVPEPGALALVMAGFGGLALGRRQRR